MSGDDPLTARVIEAAITLHRDLGPGLLESVYEALLAQALGKNSLKVARQKAIAFTYDGMTFDNGFRIDLFVEGRLIIEVKSVDRLLPVHAKQLTTYLKLTDCRVGLLINFGGETLRDGLRRIVHTPSSSSSSAPLREPTTGVIDV
jgi:GxxExxY protein